MVESWFCRASPLDDGRTASLPADVHGGILARYVDMAVAEIRVKFEEEGLARLCHHRRRELSKQCGRADMVLAKQRSYYGHYCL